MKSLNAGRRCVNAVCLLLAAVLVKSPRLEAQGGISGSAPYAQTEDQPVLKARALAIPPGTKVQLRLLNKQKVRGRIESHSDDGITVQTSPGTDVEIGFDQISALKTVKEKSRAEKALPWVWIGLGAAAVVVMVHCAHTPGCGGA